MTENRTGDTPRTSKEPALVDVSHQKHVEPQGDTTKAGYVSEPLTDARKEHKGPTGDTPRTSREPALVEHYNAEPNDKTPYEVYSGRKAVEGSPHNKAVGDRSTK